MKGLVVIVDGYGPARQIPPYVTARGYGLVHLQSTPAPLPGFTLPNPEHFTASLVHGPDTIRALRGLGAPIVAVVPGIEAGVDLADELAEAMALPGNGTSLGRARRDKYLMAARLAAEGVPAVAHHKAASADELLAWVQRYPVVVKPLDSGGTDGVFVCEDADELRRGVAAILGRTNLMGRDNREVLVQSFLRGDEYVVNAASCDGRHHVTDVWRSHKRFLPGRGFIYDREVLLPFRGEVQDQLVAYTRRVLDALGVRFGPSHAEIMLTADGPILIEVGARISGATVPAVADECVGTNQLALGVDAYVDRAAFDRVAAAPYALKKHAMLVVLACDRDGEVTDAAFMDELRRVPSLRNLNMAVTAGTRWRKTVDLKSSPGHLHLVHESADTLERDYETVQRIFHDAVSRLA